MPSVSFITETINRLLKKETEVKKEKERELRCRSAEYVIAGYFPIVAPSFDENVPWDVKAVEDEVISVYIRDETFWEKIKNGQTVKKGDYLKAVIVRSKGQNVAIKAEITDSERVSDVVETLFLNSS